MFNYKSHSNIYQIKANKYLHNLNNHDILLTGMTGFFGRPVIDLITTYRKSNSCHGKLFVLTRDIFKAKSRLIDLYLDDIIFIEGDVRNFEFIGDLDYIIHGASVSNKEKFSGASELERFNVIYEGSRNILDIARINNVKKLLYISSGSVYGKPSSGLNIKEDFTSAPDVLNDPEACYSEGKRSAELLHKIYANKDNFDYTIARCFSFIGPGMPLDINYSIGNFIRDSLYEKRILIKSDGKAIRSYMYTYDLALWLIFLLFNGLDGHAYNVGSEREITIKELAILVKEIVNPDIDISIMNEQIDHSGSNSAAAHRYIPDTTKARRLGLEEWTELRTAIINTIQFQLSVMKSI